MIFYLRVMKDQRIESNYMAKYGGGSLRLNKMLTDADARLQANSSIKRSM